MRGCGNAPTQASTVVPGECSDLGTHLVPWEEEEVS